MTARTNRGVGLCALAVCLVAAAAPALAANKPANPPPPTPVRIGMSGTLFRDVPEPMMLVLMKPFGKLMESLTGINGELVPVKTVDGLSADLADDQVQLAVFHGFEFAWARQKHPQLRPLMIAVNQERYLNAVIVVRDDSTAKGLTDLKGRDFAVANHTREHCRLYLDRQCLKLGSEPKDHFNKITKPGNVEDALDDVVDDVVQAAVVDNVSLDCYKKRKPARFGKLKVLHESEVFPCAVIAYRPGALEQAKLNKFRDGMQTAGTSATGRQLMTLWKLTGFEAVPADYDQILTDIAKAYPPPAADPVGPPTPPAPQK